MEKFIIILLSAISFTVLPVHISNTTQLTMSDSEKTELKHRVEKALIQKEIDKEYAEFFTNLENIQTTTNAKEFVKKLAYDAVSSKSLPSIVISQASLETGYGKYSKLKNNLFGIKGSGIKSKTKEFIDGKFVTIEAEFQKFETVVDAFNRHNQILNRYGVYGYDYKIWINRIVICGYATDPNYDKKLNSIIDKFQLNKLDNIQKLKADYDKIGVENSNHLPVFTYNIIKNHEREISS